MHIGLYYEITNSAEHRDTIAAFDIKISGEFIFKRIRRREHPLQVDLLLAVWTCLLLADDAPAADAELVKS